MNNTSNNNNNSNNISLYRLQDISSNNIQQKEKYGVNNLYIIEFKLFFKKYIASQKRKQNNNDAISDQSSDREYFSDIYNELNNIYLKSFKNLNNYLKDNNNLKGLRFEGNKLLENISLDTFNDLFSQHCKGMQKKLKTHSLKYLPINNNKFKLMGQQMHPLKSKYI